MNRIQQLATLLIVVMASRCLAADSIETEKYFWGTNEFTVQAMELINPKSQAKHPELLQTPSVGQTLAVRVYNGTNMIRELKGTLISSNRLDCEEGPEIRIETGTVLDFFHALYMTDRLHQTPQILEAEIITFEPPKPYIEFSPGDYWMLEEKEQFRQKEIYIPIGERP